MINNSAVLLNLLPGPVTAQPEPMEEVANVSESELLISVLFSDNSSQKFSCKAPGGAGIRGLGSRLNKLCRGSTRINIEGLI